jgi:hypothetical protein
MRGNSIPTNGYIEKRPLFNTLIIKVTDIFKEYIIIK